MGSVKKVLMIANQFPPMGGAGVQRSVKFAKYLSRLGCEVMVISKDRSKGVLDDTLISDIPDDVKVERLKGVELENSEGFLKLFKKIWAKFSSPDAEALWARDNRWDILELAEQFEPDIVYTTSYPYSDHIVGRFLKKKHPEWKWVCDYRDEWTNNPFHRDSFFGRLKLRRERHMELDINSSADFLIANTPRMLASFLRDIPSLITHSDFLPNGYDEEDFSGIDEKKDRDKRFILTHTGSLYGRRNLDEILDAITLLDIEGKVSKDKFLLRIVGNVYESVIKEYSQKYGVYIERTGYVSHRESIRYLFRSDVLLLLIGKGVGSGNFYTGKVFEYLRAKRPILAIVPDGVAKDLINETRTGLCADPSDTPQIAEALERLYRLRNEFSPDFSEIKKYSREVQTEKLLSIFESIKGER